MESTWKAAPLLWQKHTLRFAFLCSCLATEAAGRRDQQLACCLADVLFKDTNVDRFIASCLTVLSAAKEIQKSQPAASRPDVKGVSAGLEQHTRPVWSCQRLNDLVLVVVTGPLDTRQRQDFFLPP